jgi:hypothetical protein
MSWVIDTGVHVLGSPPTNGPVSVGDASTLGVIGLATTDVDGDAEVDSSELELPQAARTGALIRAIDARAMTLLRAFMSTPRASRAAGEVVDPGSGTDLRAT